YDWARADAEYSRAFRNYGIDVDALSLEETADRVRARSVGVELAAALDDWADSRHVMLPQSDAWRRLVAVARAPDTDPWRDRGRAAIAVGDMEALKALAISEDVVGQPGSTVTLLGRALSTAGEINVAVALLRRAQRARPDDFWV